ncbi:MAG: ATP-binding protein, partial [Bacteroidota bacterium]
MSNLEKDIETRKNKLDTTHYKNALNISGSGSCILDFQNKTFILSREACVILGFETKDGLVIPIHELIQKIIPGDRNKVEQIFSTFENSENLKTRFKIYKLEGDSKQQRIMYFVARKEKEYWTGIFQDITGFLEEEKEKIKEKTRENAAVVDKIKSTFLRNLSHEIRRPLNAIMGFTELLNMHDITPEKKQNYLRIINSNGNFLLKLVDDIAEVSSYSEGKLDINKTHFDVNKFLKEIFMQFKHVIKEKGKEHVELIFSNQMDTGEFKIYSDQGRIQQVLANLFSNAIKFTSKGSIEYGYEYIEEKNTIKFFMKDTGTGLDKEEQKNIFDWFSKTGDSFNKHFKGLGLGLMLSKGVVDSMDGKIWVDSNPGEGSTFHFSIPLGEERKIKKVTP